jgi:hypothetical protein
LSKFFGLTKRKHSYALTQRLISSAMNLIEGAQRMVTGFKLFASACVGVALALPTSASAGEPTVTTANASCNERRVCTFHVTVRHEDTGWEHYANKWEIRSPEGAVLGTRILHHPHEDEQPFTRSLSGVSIPASVSEVHVYAFDSIHGMSQKPFILKIPVE